MHLAVARARGWRATLHISLTEGKYVKSRRHRHGSMFTQPEQFLFLWDCAFDVKDGYLIDIPLGLLSVYHFELQHFMGAPRVRNGNHHNFITLLSDFHDTPRLRPLSLRCV